MAALKIKGVALSVGIFAALLHLIGTILIVATNGQLLNWKLSLHFLFIEFSVTAFSLLDLIIGIIVAFIAGYLVGALFAYIYNKVSK